MKTFSIIINFIYVKLYIYDIQFLLHFAHTLDINFTNILHIHTHKQISLIYIQLFHLHIFLNCLKILLK